MTDTKKATLLAISTTLVLWASAFVGIRAALKVFSPVHLALFRYVIASITLAVFAFKRKISVPTFSELLLLVLAGIVGIGIYNIVLNYGEQTVTAASACFVVNTIPIFTALMATIILKDKMSFSKWFGMFVSLGGVLLVAFGEGGGIKFERGTLFLLAAAGSSSIYFIMQKPLLKKYNSLDVVSYSIWGATLFLLFFIKGSAQEIQSANLSSLLAVIYLGVFPGAIAYLCWSYALSSMPASKISSFLYIVPIITMIIGLIFLNELPSVISIIGGSVVLTGVFIVHRAKKN